MGDAKCSLIHDHCATDIYVDLVKSGKAAHALMAVACCRCWLGQSNEAVDVTGAVHEHRSRDRSRIHVLLNTRIMTYGLNHVTEAATVIAAELTLVYILH